MGVSECRLISLIPLSFEPIQSDLSLHGYLISEKPGLEGTAWICDDKMGFLSLRPLEVNFVSSPLQLKFLLMEERSHMQLQRSIREWGERQAQGQLWIEDPWLHVAEEGSASFLGQGK